MASELLEQLPLAQRLALSYAPRAAREDTLTLLALDNRLGAILRTRGEAIIAQIKLAWWRDRLADDRANWPGGEPLLARLAGWSGDTRLLLPLVDGWEALLTERLDRARIDEFAQGRAASWSALGAGLRVAAADLPRIEQAAREWALSDLSLHLGDADERRLARAAAGERERERERSLPRLPRALRPLAVLGGLARRALRRDAPELLDGPGAALLALRIGLSGR